MKLGLAILLANSGVHPVRSEQSQRYHDFFLEDDNKVLGSAKTARFDLQGLIPRQIGGTTGIRLHTGGVLTGLASPPFVIRMCPALTLKNMEEYVPRMAVGAANGNVQILDTATGKTNI